MTKTNVTYRQFYSWDDWWLWCHKRQGCPLIAAGWLAV